MTGLIIDTSTEMLIAAVVSDNQVLSTSITTHGNQLSTALIPTIQKMFNHSPVSLKNLKFISVGVGPGSYTGTRVGVSAAKSLAFALCLPIIGFYSPLAFLPIEEGSFAYLMEAKNGAHFLLRGEKKDNQLCGITTHSGVSIEELPRLLDGVESLIIPSAPQISTWKERLGAIPINWIPSAPHLDPLPRFVSESVSAYNPSDVLNILYL